MHTLQHADSANTIERQKTPTVRRMRTIRAGSKVADSFGEVTHAFSFFATDRDGDGTTFSRPTECCQIVVYVRMLFFTLHLLTYRVVYSTVMWIVNYTSGIQRWCWCEIIYEATLHNQRHVFALARPKYLAKHLVWYKYVQQLKINFDTYLL